MKIYFFHHYSSGFLTVSNLNQRIQGKVLTWQLLSVWDSLNIKNVYIIPSLRSKCGKVETQQILLILWMHCQVPRTRFRVNAWSCYVKYDSTSHVWLFKFKQIKIKSKINSSCSSYISCVQDHIRLVANVFRQHI